MQLRKAERKKIHLKIGVSAPSGCGKTYSSLLLAKGLCGDWSKVGLIDSENGSGSLYSHLGDYQVLDLAPPFSPERYIEAINTCVKAGMEVIVIDSATHEWSGVGGCLEIHSKLGGQFTHWAKVTPRHNAFLEAILQSPIHVITTQRTKTDWSLDKNERGKTEPTKVGLKAEQREGLEYELTTAFRLGSNNLCFVEKDRTGLFFGKPEFVINEGTGQALKKWVDGGAAPSRVATAPAADQDNLVQMIRAFAGIGVTHAMLESAGRKKTDLFTASDLDDLRSIYQSIKAGTTKVSDHFTVQNSVNSLNAKLSQESA